MLERSIDSNGDLHIKDHLAKISFIRQKTNQNRYDIIVLIEEPLKHYLDFNFSWIINPKEQFGIVIREDITFKEWKNLAREYLSARKDPEKFEKYLQANLYSFLNKFVYDQTSKVEDLD